MNLTERDIEYVIAEVVRRLTSLSGGRKPPEPAPTNATFGNQIITLQTLEQLNGSKQLNIPARAIVTPAAKDELKRRGIAIVRQQETKSAQQHNTNLLAVNFGCDVNVDSLARLVAGFGAQLENVNADKLAGIIETHCDKVVRESRRAVWFTHQVAYAVCLANRQSGVWAVAGNNERELNAALESVAANVLVIDPRGKSQFTLRKMLDAFVK